MTGEKTVEQRNIRLFSISLGLQVDENCDQLGKREKVVLHVIVHEPRVQILRSLRDQNKPL